MTAARDLGTEIAARGHRLIYGGTTVGLMGEVARATIAGGAAVTGIIPRTIKDAGIAFEEGCELIVTPDLRGRKTEMEKRSDGFIALPGGFGTLEEVTEIITLKQLRLHEKPVVFLNTSGYYDPLLGVFRHICDSGFAHRSHQSLYHVVSSPREAVAYIEAYRPGNVRTKWS